MLYDFGCDILGIFALMISSLFSFSVTEARMRLLFRFLSAQTVSSVTSLFSGFDLGLELTP